MLVELVVVSLALLALFLLICRFDSYEGVEVRAFGELDDRLSIVEVYRRTVNQQVNAAPKQESHLAYKRIVLAAFERSATAATSGSTWPQRQLTSENSFLTFTYSIQMLNNGIIMMVAFKI
jgi:hypothetical protein